MNILFRVDASSEIGMGHVMRDLVMAQQFCKDNIIFATRNLIGNANKKISDSGYKVVDLPDNHVETLISTIKEHRIDMVVFDHYAIDYDFEKNIKEATDVQILSFDDTYESHYCDILLNHNISAQKERYKSLVPAHCELRCGTAYTLIRDEFKKTVLRKRESLKNKDGIRLFIAMGGVDHANLSPKIIDIFQCDERYILDVVTTSSNKHLELLKQKVLDNKNVFLHVDTNNMAELMNNADIAIITPSVTVHEVLYMELPFVAIKTAENQQDMLDYLVKERFLVLEKYDEKPLKTLIDQLRNV